MARFKTTKALQEWLGIVLDETEYGTKLMVFDDEGRRMDHDNIIIMATARLSDSVADNKVGKNPFKEHFGVANPRNTIVIFYGYSMPMRLRERLLFEIPKKMIARIIEEIPGLENKPEEWFDLFNIVDLEFAILPDLPTCLDRYTYPDHWRIINVKRGGYEITDRYRVPFEYGNEGEPIKVDMGEFKFGEAKGVQFLQNENRFLRSDNARLFQELSILKSVEKAMKAKIKNITDYQVLEGIEIKQKQLDNLRKMDEIDERANTREPAEGQRD